MRRGWRHAWPTMSRRGAGPQPGFCAVSPRRCVTTDLIQGGLQEMVNCGIAGEASVQQEHFVSALAARRLDALIAATPPPVPWRPSCLACPPDEWHACRCFCSVCCSAAAAGTWSIWARTCPWHGSKKLSTRFGRPGRIGCPAARYGSHAAGRTVRIVSRHVPVAFGGRIFNQIPELRDQRQFPGRRPLDRPGSDQAIARGSADCRGRDGPRPAASRLRRGCLPPGPQADRIFARAALCPADGPLAAKLVSGQSPLWQRTRRRAGAGKCGVCGGGPGMDRGLLAPATWPKAACAMYLTAFAATLQPGVWTRRRSGRLA